MNARQQNVRQERATRGLQPPASGRRRPARHWIFRVGYWAFLLLGAGPAAAERDPFWPIGYEPPKPEQETVEPERPVVPEKAPETPKPKPPPPVTEADWKKAKALIAVSGITQSKHPASGETRTLVMINRTSYAVGDTLSLTNANIHFTWSVESLAGLTLNLKPVRATRLPKAPSP